MSNFIYVVVNNVLFFILKNYTKKLWVCTYRKQDNVLFLYTTLDMPVNKILFYFIIYYLTQFNPEILHSPSLIPIIFLFSLTSFFLVEPLSAGPFSHYERHKPRYSEQASCSRLIAWLISLTGICRPEISQMMTAERGSC